MKRVSGLAIAVVAAVLMLGGSTVVASEADVLRESQDRALIADLMWKYVRALDSMNENAYVEVFTPDGSFDSGRGVTKGVRVCRRWLLISRRAGAEREAKGRPAASYASSSLTRLLSSLIRTMRVTTRIG